MKMSSYKEGGRRLKNCIKRIEEEVPEEDKELIYKFKKEGETFGLSKTRLLYYLNRIKKILEFKNKAFEEMGKEDIKELNRVR